MKHATDETLARIPDLLEAIAQYVPPLKEKKRGTYYLKSAAFLHFHDDPSGIFADLKVDGEWVRYRVSEPLEWPELLDAIQAQLGISG